MNTVERPRRSGFASRGKALCLGLILAGTTSNAMSAACVPARDLVALRTSALRQQLMVAALQCNRADQFNQFIGSYGADLRKSDAVLMAFFKTRNPAAGVSDYHSFKTALANLWALSASKDSTGFCADADMAFRMARSSAVVPLNAIAANIPTGRYVACAPGMGEETTIAKAEPKVMKAVARIEAPKPVAVRVAEAAPMPTPVKTVTPPIDVVPSRKPVIVAAAAPRERKTAPVMEAKPTIAQTGTPLSQYAKMAKMEAKAQPAQEAVYQRGPYEATPEELMTEADLPLSEPVAAPTTKVAVGRVAPAQKPVAPKVVQQPQVQLAEAAPIESAPRPMEEDFVAPAPNTARTPASEGYAPEDYVSREAYDARNEPMVEYSQPRTAARDYTQPRAAARQDGYYDNQQGYSRPQQQEPRSYEREQYVPREERYGRSDQYRPDDQPDDRNEYYREAPRYNQQPRRPVRERYAYAPDYGEPEYDRFARDGYDPRADVYDPYYGR